MALHLIKEYTFMAWYLVKHRDNFTFTFDARLIYTLLGMILETRVHT
jgi:hypothetical protein